MLSLEDGKILKRKVLTSWDNRINPRKSDYCTMTIYPSGVIGFRGYKSRKEITVNISSVYKLALSRDIDMGKPKRKTRKVSRGLLATFGVK